MPLKPFTTAGVNDKLLELYALSDTNLLTEVSAIYDNLAAWIEGNFSLTSQQLDYLYNAPALVRKNWAGIIGGAVSARRPIIMAAPPAYGPPRRTKQIILDLSGDLSFSPPVSGSGSIAGDMTLNISWVVVD